MNNVLNPKANAPKTEAPRIDPHVYEIGAAMEANAKEVASQSDWLSATINTIAKAKQDYEGGPFAVMFKVMEKMSADAIDALPDPDADSGNNPGIYKVKVLNAKNKPTVKDRKYYHVLSDNIPGNIAKQQRIDMLELSMKDPVQYNVSSVSQDIKDMDKDRRTAEISKLEGELSTSRTNVLAAFELLFHIRAVNALPGVEANVMYALDAQGKELNGEDGRECVVENTKTPITITTTVDGRKGKDTTQISIGSFKKLRPAVAMERGGTYQALIDSAPTVKRGTKAEDQPGGTKPERINTKETLYVRMVDVHDYLDVITTDNKQTVIASIIGDLSRKEGSDDALVTFIEVRDMLTDILNKVFKASDRYIAIKNKQKEAEGKAA
jgi:hypothetical protein